MDENYKNWLEKRDKKIKKEAIIIGSILYVGTVVVICIIGLLN